MSESVAPRIRTKTFGSNSGAASGLESISEELPIVEPENPSFKSQVRFKAPMPPQRKGPELPQANTKPALKFPNPRAMGLASPRRPGIPKANVKRPLKFPIPQAMGPELPKLPVARKEPVVINPAKAPARPAHKSHKPPDRGDLGAINQAAGLKPALRQVQQKTDRELKLKTINLMEQCLYHTQDGNMLNVEDMATRYQMTKQYRMAFICLKMDDVRNEMLSMYSYLYKNLQTYQKTYYVKTYIKIVNQILYYTHLLKKNIDITYAVEYLIEHFSEM